MLCTMNYQIQNLGVINCEIQVYNYIEGKTVNI